MKSFFGSLFIYTCRKTTNQAVYRSRRNVHFVCKVETLSMMSF